MKTGVSYFSSRDLKHVRADLREMIDHGCTYVVHCFTETDLAFARDTMRDVVAATHDAGLEAWLDPWGLCGIFSGETFTKFPLDQPETWQVLSDGRRVPAACPNHLETRSPRRVGRCLPYIGGDVLFWTSRHVRSGAATSSAWACYRPVHRPLQDATA
jgi:hypothetical protein